MKHFSVEEIVRILQEVERGIAADTLVEVNEIRSEMMPEVRHSAFAGATGVEHGRGSHDEFPSVDAVTSRLATASPG